MLIGGICIVYNIYKSNKNRQIIISDKNAKEDDKYLKSLTYMLLTASFTYLFLTLPYVIYMLLGQYIQHLYEKYDAYISALHLWAIISFCLMYLNNSVNFLLYCISGELFREEFLVMCGCLKRLTPRQKVIEQARRKREERLKEREKKHMVGR